VSLLRVGEGDHHAERVPSCSNRVRQPTAEPHWQVHVARALGEGVPPVSMIGARLPKLNLMTR
jgi:hypothetical protein